MHELAITRSMLNQVLASAQEHGAGRVTSIRLLVGEAAGIVPGCVQFYFDQMKQGTSAQDARLEFRAVPLRLRCPRCGREFSRVEDLCLCNAGADVVSGEELTVESIEVEQ
jgi:hydrogenase nickel incorporation protein HypA/HybF